MELYLTKTSHWLQQLTCSMRILSLKRERKIFSSSRRNLFPCMAKATCLHQWLNAIYRRVNLPKFQTHRPKKSLHLNEWPDPGSPWVLRLLLLRLFWLKSRGWNGVRHLLHTHCYCLNQGNSLPDVLQFLTHVELAKPLNVGTGFAVVIVEGNGSPHYPTLHEPPLHLTHWSN